MMNIRDISSNVFNIPGWSTRKKIVILESDDWGSIRMPSITAYEKLKYEGLDLDSGDLGRYNLNDTIESSKDLENLYDVLSSVTGSDGRCPVMTMLYIVGNPDFDRIKANDYSAYHWESSFETYVRYGRNGVADLLEQGIRSNLISIQFHGREHLNVPLWMRSLAAGDKQALKAFEYGLWGYNNLNEYNIHFQSAFDLERYEDIVQQHQCIREGLDLFQSLFGYRACFFVPPNGPYNNELSQTAAECGIKYLSLSKKHFDVLGMGKKNMCINWLGKHNKFGQIILTRNCVFEPNLHSDTCISRCIRQIELSFRWNKPAVISTHRVNYIGSLNENNRELGLSRLKGLLESITRRWPEVIFMSSDGLGSMISENK